MKILHIISGGDKGGAKTHMFALLDELCKMADVTVVCLMRGVFYNEIIERDVNVVLLEQKSRFDMSVMRELKRMIREDVYDIVNAHGARANFLAAKLVNEIDIPVVTTIHSDYLLDFDTPYKKLIFEKLNRAALNKIRYKIAVSDAFRNMLISRGFMPNDITTVYNGMDFGVAYEPTDRREFAEKYGVPYDEDTVYVGIAARFDHVKGVDVFIRAAAEVLAVRDNVRFVVAGEGDEKDALTALANELGVSDRVHFIGFVSPIYDFLGFVDINTLTSRSESFPYSILEGARASKPTVAAAVGGIPHLISNGKTGYLFAAEDHSACAVQMLKLIDSPEKRAEFGDAIYKKASSEFSNRALAEQYLKNYAEFIRKNGRKKRYDVMLSGYYGFDNFGDELILSSIITKLRRERPECEIVVLSRSPEKTMLRFGVDALSRYNYPKVRRAMRRSRIYVNGGGTLFTDVTSTHSLIYYVFMINAARRAGLKTAILANGVGPFLRERNMSRAMKAMKRVDLITLRDRKSYDFIREKLPDSNPYLSGDLIFSLYTTENEFDGEDVPSLDLPENYFAISIRDSVLCGDEFVKTVAAVCTRIEREYGLVPVFVPMQMSRDDRISHSCADLIDGKSVVLPKTGADEKIKVIRGARFVMGMRLHSLMLAALYRIPIVALAYDVKVSSFVSENGLADVIDVSAVEEKKLYEQSVRCLNDTDANRRYAQVLEEMHRLSNVSVRQLIRMIDQK